nr:unnamed protein product [Digitaria exilis]
MLRSDVGRLGASKVGTASSWSSLIRPLLPTACAPRLLFSPETGKVSTKFSPFLALSDSVRLDLWIWRGSIASSREFVLGANRSRIVVSCSGGPVPTSPRFVVGVRERCSTARRAPPPSRRPLRRTPCSASYDTPRFLRAHDAALQLGFGPDKPPPVAVSPRLAFLRQPPLHHLPRIIRW